MELDLFLQFTHFLCFGFLFYHNNNFHFTLVIFKVLVFFIKVLFSILVSFPTLDSPKFSFLISQTFNFQYVSLSH